MTVAGGRALSMSGGGASASRPATYAARLRSPRSERKARTSAGPAKNQNHNTRYLRPLALGLVFALVLGVDFGMAFAFFGFAFSLRGASSGGASSTGSSSERTSSGGSSRKGSGTRGPIGLPGATLDRKSTRLNSSHLGIS